MADDKAKSDVNEEEDEDVLSESSTEESESESESAEAASQPSEEEEETLPEKETNANKRIRELVEENKRLKADAESKGTASVPPAPQAPDSSVSEEARKAADVLHTKMGFIKREDLEETLKGELQKLQDRIILDQTHDRLEVKYNGFESTPKYDRTVVEDHIRRTGILNPEVAYKDMYEDELLDYHVKQIIKKKAPYSEQPGKPARKAPPGLSREDIAKMTPGDYEKNRADILKLVASGEL